MTLVYQYDVKFLELIMTASRSQRTDSDIRNADTHFFGRRWEPLIIDLTNGIN